VLASPVFQASTDIDSGWSRADDDERPYEYDHNSNLHVSDMLLWTSRQVV